MSEYPPEENKKNEESRFYEPRNWDKELEIEEETNGKIFCGKCGHIIYQNDKFCTKCGAEAVRKNTN